MNSELIILVAGAALGGVAQLAAQGLKVVELAAAKKRSEEKKAAPKPKAKKGGTK